MKTTDETIYRCRRCGGITQCADVSCDCQVPAPQDWESGLAIFSIPDPAAAIRAARDALDGHKRRGRLSLYSLYPHETAMNTPTKPTFHKHGKDWFPHTPGDPCPVDKDAMVLILTKDMEESDVPEPASSWCWDRLDRWPDARVLGWRYADPQPEIAESAPVELARLREENANMRTAINAADYLVSIARADLVPGSFTKDTLDQAIEALQPFTQP